MKEIISTEIELKKQDFNKSVPVLETNSNLYANVQEHLYF
jgi:hypothetical protein